MITHIGSAFRKSQCAAMRRAVASSSWARRSFTSAKPPTPPGGHQAAGPTAGSPVSWASMGLVALVGSGLAMYYNIEKDRRQKLTTGKVKTVGKAAIGGPWALFDKSGSLRTDKDFRGTFSLVYFGFSKCPDICPNELVKTGKIFSELEKDPELKGKVKPLFISIDPCRDTVEQLQKYSTDFHPAFSWLTGTPSQVNSIAKAFRVYWSKVDVTEGRFGCCTLRRFDIPTGFLTNCTILLHASIFVSYLTVYTIIQMTTTMTTTQLITQ